MNAFRQYALFFAWLIALSAMVITLYSSEFLHQQVCHLCWYQRICIYPLVILLGIAAFRDDKDIIPYALPFVIIGGVFAIYHYMEQMIPGFGPINFCGTSIDCAQIHFRYFGFITYPFLTITACVLMAILLVLARKQSEITA